MAEQPASGRCLRVETTTDGPAEAERVARSVIEARLVACAQVGGPVTSCYRWDGEVRFDKEWTVVMKTAADRLDALTAHLVETHGYDVPEIVAVPIEGGNPDYLRWVLDETRPEA
ncbi:divalent-cation tolerance protein CutA [Marinitenerispora sediminis]|uniref:Divalent-cation tolerance protein CutA n=1 Tax=Marinitenerispora sediminis TaxID=1931232 RepID=A0A368T8F4_9ACTN|nr:divalent-cation tolerance protein CutA [Marinitenerispora sediminis]RCV51366.1 divalent-cation tolerance protein CutA [Marinitenerispora sediminis]RCV57194.1 divalent-cation tolerance protein CutA [Marinitenerispora sediminis]RCV60299.1 divalent-cation tolerance protein CutA [Marinitenerispora sediminis]